MNLPEIVSPTPDAPRVDKRAVFFFCSAVLCGVLLPLCPEDYRWVGWTLVVVYLVLTLLSALDHYTRRRHQT